MRWKCCSSGMFIDFYEYADPAVRLGQRIRFVRFQDGRGCYGRIWGQGVFPSQDYAHQLLHSGYSGLVSINGLSTRYQEDPAAADRRNRAAVLAMLSGKEESSLWI